MNVLHLNTHAGGGSYEYASLLSRTLCGLGVDSRVLTRSEAARPFSDKLLRRAALSFACGAWHGTRRSAVPPAAQELMGTDVVHLHTVADWFDVPRWLEALPGNVKVVVSLHDLWHISGGCFVYDICSQFRTGCSSCPLLYFPANRIFAADELGRKQRVYRRRNTHFIANSHWLKRVVADSRVLDGLELSVIPPPVDTLVFRAQNREACRSDFGLKPEDRVVCTGCTSLTDTNKNTLGLLKILSSLNDPRLRVLVFGDGSLPCPPGLQVKWLGSMSCKESLARAYAAADVFASASRMETFGLTLAEALCCGTPVVAYKVGGIPEAAPLAEMCRLCQPDDETAFAAAVAEMLDLSRQRSENVTDEHATLRDTLSPQAAAKAALAVYAV